MAGSADIWQNQGKMWLQARRMFLSEWSQLPAIATARILATAELGSGRAGLQWPCPSVAAAKFTGGRHTIGR